MTNILRSFLALTLLFVSSLAGATPLSGSLRIYDPTGVDLCAPGLGGGSGCGSALTGDYDSAAGTLSFDPVILFGLDMIARSVELLPVGTHTRSDGAGGILTASVAPGQVGAYVVLDWGFNVFSTFMVWNVTGSAISQTFSPVDSDGDGVPGHALTSGPFIGFNGIYEFHVGQPGPNIDLAVDVTGGTLQQCTGAYGTPVTFTASVNLTGGAELDSITWTVDGNPAGTGISISPSLDLGTHLISATALTTTGETDFKTLSVNVVDRTAPTLNIAFVDSRSGDPVSQIDRPNVQWIEVSFSATDVCDPAPTTNGVGGFAVHDGDLLKIQGNNDTVTMTTSVLTLSVTSKDASGNTRSGTATLQITD